MRKINALFMLKSWPLSENLMSNMIENGIETTIFRSRWLLAPFYLGLVFSIVLLLIKFGQELWHMTFEVLVMSESDIIVGILALVDMSLVGSLLLMIIFSGYEIFVSKIQVVGHEDRPDWMGKIDFSGLKLKVIGAIVAISAIDLLKTFVNLPDTLTDEQSNALILKISIHLVFVISGVMFALMDKIAGSTNKDH